MFASCFRSSLFTTTLNHNLTRRTALDFPLQRSTRKLVHHTMSTRSAGKRKLAVVDIGDDEVSESPVHTPKAKRAKSSKASTAGPSSNTVPTPAPPLVKAKSAPEGSIPTTATTAPGAMPTNKSLPEEIFFDRPESGNVRIVAWNVCESLSLTSFCSQPKSRMGLS